MSAIAGSDSQNAKELPLSIPYPQFWGSAEQGAGHWKRDYFHSDEFSTEIGRADAPQPWKIEEKHAHTQYVYCSTGCQMKPNVRRLANIQRPEVGKMSPENVKK